MKTLLDRRYTYEEKIEQLSKAILLLKQVDEIIQNNIPNGKEISEYGLNEFYDCISDVEMKHSELVVNLAKGIGLLHTKIIIEKVFPFSD